MVIYPGVELLDHMVLLFLGFEASPYCFHSGYSKLYSHQQVYEGVPFSPHPRQHLLLVFSLMIPILTGVM